MMVLHTGRDLDQLVADDFFELRAWSVQKSGRAGPGAHLAWDLLRGIADLGEYYSLRDALRLGQRTCAELVDANQLRCRPVRDVLVRYLEERRPAMDYGSLTNLAYMLAGNFWADIERRHPEVQTLRLPDDIVRASKQRHQVVVNEDGTTRPNTYLDDLMKVRTFYLDIQEWAEEDPWWVPGSLRALSARATPLAWPRPRSRSRRRCTNVSATGCRTCRRWSTRPNGTGLIKPPSGGQAQKLARRGPRTQPEADRQETGVSLDRMRERQPTGPVNLGILIIIDPTR